MAEFAEAYPNAEVDIVYRGQGIFDITHDAGTTFHLGLDAYFARIGKSHTRLWLDIKNLNPGNAGHMLRELDSLRRHYGVALEQLIVESSSADALARFTRRGYYTSFTFPL